MLRLGGSFWAPLCPCWVPWCCECVLYHLMLNIPVIIDELLSFEVIHMVLLALGCNLGDCYTAPPCSVCGAHMVRGAPDDQCMLEPPTRRKRKKEVVSTPSTLNPNASATPHNSGIPEQIVPCGTSGRGADVESLQRNTAAPNSPSSELHNTSQQGATNGHFQVHQPNLGS